MFAFYVEISDLRVFQYDCRLNHLVSVAGSDLIDCCVQTFLFFVFFHVSEEIELFRTENKIRNGYADASHIVLPRIYRAK